MFVESPWEAGHFVAEGRRNTGITVVLFDNQVYGLTKGAVPVPISFGNVVSEAVSDGTPTRYFNTFGAAATLAVLVNKVYNG